MEFSSGQIQTVVIALSSEGHQVVEWSAYTMPERGRGVAEDLQACLLPLEAAIDKQRGQGLIGVGFKESEPYGLVQSGLSDAACRRLYLQGAVLKMLFDRGVQIRTYIKANMYSGLGLTQASKRRNDPDAMEELRKNTQELSKFFSLSDIPRTIGQERFQALVVAMLAAEQLP